MRAGLTFALSLLFPFAALPGLSKDPQATGEEKEQRTSGSEGQNTKDSRRKEGQNKSRNPSQRELCLHRTVT